MPRATTDHRALASGEMITAHFHDENQIIYASQGVLGVTTGQGMWVAPPMRALWIPKGAVHAHRAHGATELHLVGVSADVLDVTEPVVFSVAPLLKELIIRASHLKERAGWVHELLCEEIAHAPRDSFHLPALRDPRLRALAAVFAADAGDPRSLDELAAEVHSTARTLSRLFRAEAGMTFPQWRNHVRLYQSLILLSNGESVTRTAIQCGWATASAFIDTFRRAFGYSPGRHLSAGAAGS